MTIELLLGLLRRFWPLAVGGVVIWGALWGWHTIDDLRIERAGLKAELKIMRNVVERCRDFRATIERLEAQNENNRKTLERVAVDRDEWRRRFVALTKAPPEMRVEYRDRIDSSTAETMATTGAAVSRSLAGELRIVLDEDGAP